MAREYDLTFHEYDNWKLPFNIAIGLHLAVILGVVFFPQIFKNTPRFENIYTVDLINTATPAPPQPAPSTPSRQPAEEPREIKKVELKKVVPIAEAAPEQPPLPEAKPVSIKPLKRKIKKEKVERVSAEERRRLEKIAQMRREEARRAEEMAEEAARLAASEAVNQLKEMLRQSRPSPASDDIPPPRSNQGGSSGQNRNVVENQYYASIYSRIQPHWKLPEHKMLAKDLSATIVIQVSKDGNITNQFFEKKSGDRLFDQFVLKALQDAAPLPPIPGALAKGSVEIGLTFIPGSIY